MKLKKSSDHLVWIEPSQQLPAHNEPTQRRPSSPDTENEDQTQIGSVLGFETFVRVLDDQTKDWRASRLDVSPDLNDGSCVSLKHVVASD